MRRISLRRISLQRRMVAASAVLALLVAGVFVALILALDALREAREDEARSKDVTSAALGLERQVLEVDSGLSIYVITGDPTLLQRYRRSRKELEERLASFARITSREPQQRARAGELFELIGRYRTDYLNLVTLLARDSIGAAREATRDEGSEQLRSIQHAFERFLSAENVLARSRKDAADAKFTHAIELGVAGLTGSAALILLFAFYLSRSIARPVREAAEGATNLAAGDLSLRLS
jgi:CHASE3 domain sensor protein